MATTQIHGLEELSARIKAIHALPSPNERRALRLAARVSLADLASACGVSRQAVHSWEMGRRIPRAGNLGRYLAVLGVLEEAVGDR